MRRMWVLQVKEHMWRNEFGEGEYHPEGRWTVIFKSRWKFVVMMYYTRRNTPLNQYAGVEYRILRIEPIRTNARNNTRVR